MVSACGVVPVRALLGDACAVGAEGTGVPAAVGVPRLPSVGAAVVCGPGLEVTAAGVVAAAVGASDGLVIGWAISAPTVPEGT